MFAALARHIGQPEAAPPWGIFAGVNVALVGLIAIVAGSFIGLSVFGGQPYAALASWMIGCLITVIFISVSHREPEARDALRLGATRTRLYLVLLFSLGMAVLIDLVDLGATGAFLPAPELIDLSASPSTALAWLFAIPFMLVVQPAAEELIFRGVFYPAARARLGPWAAIILTAAVYAIFHYAAYGRPEIPLWHALVSPFLAGIALTGVRAYTGSTRAAIIAHAAFGLFALLKVLALAG